MNRTRLCVVIVNYRTADLVNDCLATLPDEVASVGGAKVVVVDNGSGDGSIDAIERFVNEQGWGFVKFLRSPDNGGFSAGNNYALRRVDADRYLLLNSDTLVHPGALAALMSAMDARPDVGLVGPRIEFLDGVPQNTCYRFRTPLTEFLAAAKTSVFTRLLKSHEGTHPVPEQPFEPDWVSFACCLIRREVFDQIGLLDEGYFMYFDDIDLCRRAQDAGWKVLFWPEARVVHLRGQSGPVKKLAARRKRKPPYFYHSRNRYYAKFYGRMGMWVTNILWELGRAIAWLREVLRTKKPHTCEREALDIWSNAWNPMGPPHDTKGSAH